MDLNPYGSNASAPPRIAVPVGGAAAQPAAAVSMSALLAARSAALTSKPGQPTGNNNSSSGSSTPSASNPALVSQGSSADLRFAAGQARPAGPATSASSNPMNGGIPGGPLAGRGGASHGHHAINPNAWSGQGVLLQPNWAIDVTAEECAVSTPLKGETSLVKDVDCYWRGPLGQRVPGLLSITTYQMRFTPTSQLPSTMKHLPLSAFSVPISSIRKIERPVQKGGQGSVMGMGGGGPTPFLDVTAKDVRTLLLGFRDELTADKMANHLKMVVFPPKLELVHAFSEGSKASTGLPSGTHLPGWDLYNPRAEMERQGVLSVRHPRTGEPLYRCTDINSNYSFAPTYPALIVSPFRASDAMLQSVAGFRSKARIPALTWMHPGNKTTMWRCSQPRVGLQNNSNAQDETLLAMVRESNVHSRDPHQPLLIADCRPRANAMANKAGGWGYEVYTGTTLEFLNIHNIHAVRDSHRSVEALCLAHAPQDTNWTSAVNETQWLYHLRTVISAGLFVAESMHRKGQNVLVHCSDGWDRTAQVCGLVQLMLDPYFRTIKGFGVLVNKDWASFGHKFGERAGHREEKDGGDISPVFVQFLDAVWQFVRLFPQAFEFDGRLLLYCAHHVYACRFGDFLASSERERLQELQLPHRTPSLWAHVLAHGDMFRNHGYNPLAGDVLLPHPAAVLRNVCLWSDWFLRHSPYPSSSAECRMERYAESVYNRQPVLAALLPGSMVGVQEALGQGDGTPLAAVAVAGGSTDGAASVPVPGGGGGASPDAAGVSGEAEEEATLTTAYLARDEGDKVGETGDD